MIYHCSISKSDYFWQHFANSEGEKELTHPFIYIHLFWVSFTHLHLCYTSCSHCSAATQTQQSWQRTDPTWWCPWCWGCSVTAPETDVRRMRMCWKSQRVAGQSWWAWWLAWHCRWTWGDHSLLLGSRFHSVWLKKNKMKLKHQKCSKSSSETTNSTCCFNSESVIVE